MPEKKFEYTVFVSIGDTNMEGNVYWLNYFAWLGKAREVFLMFIFPNFLQLFSSGARIITHETNIKHIAPSFFSEEIVLEISTGEVRNTSTKIFVQFVKKSTGEKIAEGWQTLVFIDKEGKPALWPPKLKEAVLKYVSS